MTNGRHGESLLALVSDGVTVDEAAQRLVQDGVDAEALSQVEAFLRALEADPSARDRALLLIERTGLLAERAAEGAQRSEQLAVDASRMSTTGTGSPLEAVRGVLHHELTTPVTVARLALEQLDAHRLDPATSEQMVSVALRSLRLAARLLESLGRAEDLQKGWAELSWAQVDLGGLVRECVTDVGSVLVDRHEFTVTVPRAVAVPGDADAVRQILFNLLTNAVKFSPAGSRIEVTATATDTHAEVAVRDRGPGIAPKDAGRIFEAGQRLGSKAPGRGLGLFIAHQLAQAHGGDLRVEAAPGGSRFVLHLPFDTAAWQRSLARREEAITARAAGQRERAAIADARDAELAQREVVAAERDAALGSRESVAHERDAALERRDEA